MNKAFLIFSIALAFSACKEEEPLKVPDYMLERFHSRMSCDTISYVRAYFPDSMVLITDTLVGIRTGYHSGDYHGSYIERGNITTGFGVKFDAIPNIKKQYDLILTGSYQFDPHDRTGGAGVEFDFYFESTDDNGLPTSEAASSIANSEGYFYVKGRKGDNRLMFACGTFDLQLRRPMTGDTVRVFGDYNLKFYDPYSYP